MDRIQKALRVSLAAALMGASTDGLFAYRNEDRPYAFSLPSQINPEIPDYNRRVDLNLKSYAQPPAMNFRAFLAPDLNINSYSMRLPAIEVRDIGNSVWSYEKESYHFNADLKQFDSYQAQIHFNLDGAEAPNTIAYEVGKMRFEPGKATPESYRRTYQDQSGNLLRVDRSNQESEINPSYNSFIQFFERENRSWGYASERNSKASRPIEPTRELVQGFEENWGLAGRDEAGGKINSSVIVRLDDIKHETNLHRFISSYSGSVQDGKTTLQFAVVSPHDDKGTVKSLDFEIKAPGAPIAKISWKPVAGANGDEAFKLLRDNLPVPVLLGPRGSFRFNGVDLAEAPLKITSDGNIALKQLGDAKDLSNLMGQENLGIGISFAPPTTNSPKAGFSLGNSLRNLWYMATGRWAEVKGLRQQLTTMSNKEPATFVLTVGFRDPSFMGIKELRSISSLQNRPIQMKNKSDQVASKSNGKENSFFYDIKALLKAPFRLVGGVIATVLDLPGIKQVSIGTRVVIGVASGVLSGDIFDRSNPIKFDPDGPAVIAMCGMNTTGKKADDLNGAVKTAFDIHTITSIKNSTHWFIAGDLIQSFNYEYLGSVDKPVLDTVKAIRVGIKEKGEVFVVAHSQGSAEFKQTLSLLKPEEKSKIHYIGIGPEWIIDAKTEGLASATNVWNKGDPIPTIGNRLKFITNLVLPWNWGRSSSASVEREDVGAKWGAAHGVKYYEEAINKWAEKWREQWAYGVLLQSR